MIVSQNTNSRKGPLHCWHEFHSAEEFITQSIEGKNSEGWNYWDGFNNVDYHSFYACSGPIQARDIAEHGFAEGREAVAKLKAKIENQIGRRGKMFASTYDVVGGAVDVGVYLSGEPECMIAFEEVDSTQEQFVDIHFSSGVSGCIETSEMVRNGAAVCALVDALEDNGKRVRLTWERSSGFSHDDECPVTSVFVVLKDHKDVLDLDRIAFFCTSPIARRAMAWSLDTQGPIELVRKQGLSSHLSIGTSPANNPKYRKGCDVWVGAMVGGTDAQTAEWVLAQLKKLGVDIVTAS